MAWVASRADTGAAWGAGEAGSGSGAMGSDGPSAWLSGGASDSAEAPRGTVIGPKDTGRLGGGPPADRIRSVRGPEATPGNAKILATTYFPERLPSQYLRRWRA